MALTWINGPIIAAGESLSDGLDVSGGALVRITMPKEWTDAELSFQISTDGDAYNDLYSYQDGEVRVPVTPGAAMLLPADLTRGIGWIKFRSGLSGNPRPQPEQRNFAVTVETVGGTSERETKPAVEHSGAKRYRRPVPVKRKTKGRR